LRMFLQLALLLAIGSVSNAAAMIDQLNAKLDAGEMAWNRAQLTTFSYTLIDGGAFGYSIYKVTVRNGKCSAKSKLSPDTQHRGWRRDTCDGHGIAELISEIRRVVNAGIDHAELECDGILGYPAKFLMEPPAAAGFDLVWYIEISHFTAKHQNAKST
jgi:hypothetical protein